MKLVCRHCHDPARPVNRPRGLCWTCWHTPGVRDLYPSTSKCAPGREPTAQEVEATVAEQMRCLPAWWSGEAGKD